MGTIKRLLLLLFAPEKLPHLKKGTCAAIAEKNQESLSRSGRPDAYLELGLETPHLFSEDD